MGHSQADKAITHERIVAIAAKRFRELGFDGIGVADVMTEAGLTVGGFYKHFESRDALVTEALAASFLDTRPVEFRAKRSLRKAIRDYLSPLHRDNLGSGCPFTALLSDVGRGNLAIREVYTVRLKSMFDLLETLLPADIAAARRPKIMLLFSACVGAMGLSRAITDLSLSNEILDSVADELVQLVTERRAQAKAA